MINLLKKLYENIWVPILGRFISIFIPLIEGKKTIIKPTYNLKHNRNK